MRIGLFEMAEKRAIEKAESPRVFGQARKLAKMFRAGLYARVSTNDRQTIPLQIRALREYAARRDWTIVLQVKEVGSGTSKRELRERVLYAARRREIDMVLVWRLDRWGRSVTDLLTTLQELEHLGVGFVSLNEALDLTAHASPASPLCGEMDSSSPVCPSIRRLTRWVHKTRIQILNNLAAP